jgi:hypothetical protein
MSEASATRIQIKSIYGHVLYECDVPEHVESGMALRHALEAAVSSGAYLSGAYLRGADLSGADLSGADLSGAYLRGVDLRGAYLRGAYLSGAYLRGAYLSGAYLRGVDLRGVDLSGVDLRGVDLSEQKNDFWEILLRAPHEIAGLRAALVAGRVDGSTYSGECACLVGTIANVRGADYTALGNGIEPDSGRPAEQWFMNIRQGDTPETSHISALTVEWLDEFVSLLDAAKA